MSRFQVVPFAISANFGYIFPWKSTQVKIHSKMASVCLVFSAKNPVKSDKLALIEGKVLNEMILDIYIPVVPIDNWLGVTHNQRQKNSQSRFSPIIPPYFKDEIVAWMHIYYMFYTNRFARLRPQIARARPGGQSGKDTAVINIKLKEAMKIIVK